MSREHFRIHRSTDITLIELELSGVLDHLEFDRLNQSLLAVIDATPAGRWIIDLAHVSYMTSPVLGLMVNLRQRVKQTGGTLVLCSMSPQLARTFHTCSLERLFAITRDRDEAFASL